jgi:hypothetical protein
VNGGKIKTKEIKLTKVKDNKKDFESILAATNKKNPAQQDIEALRELIREDSSIWQSYGDWAQQPN